MVVEANGEPASACEAPQRLQRAVPKRMAVVRDEQRAERLAELVRAPQVGGRECRTVRREVVFGEPVDAEAVTMFNAVATQLELRLDDAGKLDVASADGLGRVVAIAVGAMRAATTGRASRSVRTTKYQGMASAPKATTVAS